MMLVNAFLPFRLSDGAAIVEHPCVGCHRLPFCLPLAASATGFYGVIGRSCRFLKGHDPSLWGKG